MRYINPIEMRALDINSSYFGVGLDVLMDNAGRAVFESIQKIEGLKNKRIAFFCGLGNNGGDGFVAAAYLRRDGYKPRIYLVGKKGDVKTREARNALALLEETGARIQEVSKPDEPEYQVDIIVDSLLGIGLQGEPKEPLKGIIKRINDSGAYVVSIDVPSGLGT